MVALVVPLIYRPIPNCKAGDVIEVRGNIELAKELQNTKHGKELLRQAAAKLTEHLINPDDIDIAIVGNSIVMVRFADDQRQSILYRQTMRNTIKNCFGNQIVMPKEIAIE